MPAIRRTKIVATLGPATDDPRVLRQLIEAGVDVVRLNFSHGSKEDHLKRAAMVREISVECGRVVAILGDLQGPKIRISRFRSGAVDLKQGERFALDASMDADAGDASQVGIDYKALPKDCHPQDMLLLDDGRIVLLVESVQGKRINCRVAVGGTLSNNKGINRHGGGLSAPALTVKDKADILTAASIGMDYVAVSFPRAAADIEAARTLLEQAGSEACLVAKIERAEAVASEQVLDEIIRASDAVMVARGDLGVEIGDAKLVGMQKKIIARARALNRAVITATQMMETMIQKPLPTRAEVMDVANAVLDGTDAVMLSAETASGQFPVQTVQAMDRVILGAEQERSIQKSTHRMDEHFDRIDEAIAMATMYTANHLKGMQAIICMTESGSAPLQMSRISSGIPICAFSRHPQTQRKLALYRGVVTTAYREDECGEELTWQCALRLLKEQGVVKKGDMTIITQGDETHKTGGTNTMKIVAVK